tara:strand:- start:540 stop:1484 length:945 start_codon:yes stop_codon:yes gene_type:complete
MGTATSQQIFNNAIGQRVLQQRVQEFNPTAAQALTGSYADVDGSDYAFTPTSANSLIVYKYNFHESVAASVDYGTHYLLMVDGVEETESRQLSSRETTNVYAQGQFTYEKVISSWGTTEKTIKMQANEGSNAAQLHETHTGNLLVRAVLTITEYGTSPVTINSDLSGKSILQQILEPYNPTAAQSLTTTLADIDGSDFTFTPVSASSQILYRYSFIVATQDLVIIPSFKLFVNAVEETESGVTQSGGDTATYQADDIVNYEHVVDSWGTSAYIMKLQGKEFSASYDTKIHETYYYEGSASSVLKRAVLQITEYE